jgi:hypothetical protein
MQDREKKTEVLKFRATLAQRHELQRRALDYGFSSVSAFILWATLEEDHTEGGAAALTAALEKIDDDAKETLSRIREDFQSDREEFSAAADEAAARFETLGEVYARKFDEALARFEEEHKAAARAADIERKKAKEELWAELLPVVGIAAAVIVAVYVFQHFIK